MLGAVTTREPTHGTASGVVGAAAGARCTPWVLVAAIVLVAANLRTLMASLPPLAEAVRADLGLSSAWMGVLTTLPVLCMGLLAGQVAARCGRCTPGRSSPVRASPSPARSCPAS